MMKEPYICDVHTEGGGRGLEICDVLVDFNAFR